MVGPAVLVLAPGGVRGWGLDHQRLAVGFWPDLTGLCVCREIWVDARKEAVMENAGLRIGIPKGRLQEAVTALMIDAGIDVTVGSRNYRPRLSWPDLEAKLLKPQNVVKMLHKGSRDIGFAGADWVAELDLELVELLDTTLNPVRIVAAAPPALLDDGQLPRGARLVVATEYVALATRWIENQPFDGVVVQSYGGTEAFPPDDADLIVDNISTGATLRGNGLRIVDTLMSSSTRLYANPAALDDSGKQARIDDIIRLLQSVLDARQRVMLDLNVGPADVDRVITILPCMREPTVAKLHGDTGYAIRAAVPKADLSRLILELRARGATDLIVSRPQQIVQ